MISEVAPPPGGKLEKVSQITSIIRGNLWIAATVGGMLLWLGTALGKMHGYEDRLTAVEMTTEDLNTQVAILLDRHNREGR